MAVERHNNCNNRVFNSVMAHQALLDSGITRKIRDLIRSADTGIMTTPSSRLPVASGKGNMVEWDETGALWFREKARENDERSPVIRHHVKLFYSDPATSGYLSIYGEAELEQIKPNPSGFWNSVAALLSPDAAHADELRIRKIVPTDAFLWDNDTNRMLSLFDSRQNQPLPEVVVSCLFGEVVLNPQEQSSIANVA